MANGTGDRPRRLERRGSPPPLERCADRTSLLGVAKPHNYGNRHLQYAGDRLLLLVAGSGPFEGSAEVAVKPYINLAPSNDRG